MALNQEFWLQQKRREASWQLILIPYCWAIEVTFRQSGLPKEAGSGTRATMGAFETAPVCTALGAAHAAAADGCPTAHRRNVPRSALRSGASAERTEMRRSLCRRRHGRMPHFRRLHRSRCSARPIHPAEPHNDWNSDDEALPIVADCISMTCCRVRR